MNGKRESELLNVTVSLSAELVRQARHLAVDRGISLSRYIALLLEQEVGCRHRYQGAKERQAAVLQAGLALGTRGTADWERSDLHER